MIDIAQIWLSDAEKTVSCGKSLAKTIYGQPVEILLSGELGAGKTTFLTGFAQGLGINDYVTSPTFALEQRYNTKSGGEYTHIDLYRLSKQQAEELLQQSDDHRGIRCIEWPERAESISGDIIKIQLEDKESERQLRIEFDDIPLPSREQIEQWRKDVLLPEHICKHCDVVTDVCDQLATALLERSVIVRPLALKRAAEVHDLLRFIDFKPGASHIEEHHTEQQLQTWKEWTERYPNIHHEEACAAFLKDEGFSALAKIVLTHGLQAPAPRETIEQKILCYADKRVKMDEIVTLDERFEDFKKRYGQGKETEEAKKWRAEVEELEEDLFGGKIPM